MKLLLPDPGDSPADFWFAGWPAFCTQAPLPPFAPEALAFLDAFSKRILLDPALRRDAPLAALAHWARAGHLREYAAALPAGRVRAARGVVLNLSPANVDTLFAYGWFTALLCGNATVVRVSRRSATAIEPLLALLRTLLAEPAHAAVRARTLVVSYEHDDALTARLSAGCHVRLVWGGDATVRAIRAVPLPATAHEIAFADRFSLAAFSAAHVVALGATELVRLAEDFANDAFVFGQKACASPRAVVWVGDADAAAQAGDRFWPAVARVAAEKFPGFNEADGVTRLASAMALAAHCPGSRLRYAAERGAPPLVLAVPAWPVDLRDQHDGAGLFVESTLPALAELAPLLQARDQTLVVAGFGPEELPGLAARLPARALDRIVPAGRALDFDPTAWDGHNLIASLTREIPVF